MSPDPDPAEQWDTMAKSFQSETTHPRLQIAFQFDTSDPRTIAEELEALATWALDARANEAFEWARRAEHFGELARRRLGFVGTAMLLEGPRDPIAKRNAHQQFRVRVHRAVKLAGLVMDEEMAFQVWSECLRRRKYSLKLGTIEDATEASRLLCLHFAASSPADIQSELAFATSLEQVGTQEETEPEVPPPVQLLPERVDAVETSDALAPLAPLTTDPLTETVEQKAQRRQTWAALRLRKAGLNRKTWADAARCDPKVVYRWWAGKGDFRADVRLNLARVLGVDADELPD